MASFSNLSSRFSSEGSKALELILTMSVNAADMVILLLSSDSLLVDVVGSCFGMAKWLDDMVRCVC